MANSKVALEISVSIQRTMGSARRSARRGRRGCLGGFRGTGSGSFWRVTGSAAGSADPRRASAGPGAHCTALSLWLPFAGWLARFMAATTPWPAKHSTASTARGSTRRTTASSPLAKGWSTHSAVGTPEGGRPMPMRRRGTSRVPSRSSTSRRPRCPPSPPRARRRICPRGRSTSSRTISSSRRSEMPSPSAAAATASPEAFMKVWGASRTSRSPAHCPWPRRAWKRRWSKEMPSRRARCSSTRQPTSCRLLRKAGPGLPSPTMSFTPEMARTRHPPPESSPRPPRQPLPRPPPREAPPPPPPPRAPPPKPRPGSRPCGW